MIGKPKYSIGDEVYFLCCGNKVRGNIAIVDAYGTFEQNEEPSYDIMVEEANTLYKHIREQFVISEE